MSAKDTDTTASRWRKALTVDEEKGGGVHNNIRLLLVCVGTLFVLLVSFLAVNSGASTDIYHGSVTSKILEPINNSTLGFQKIFVISLASRTDRRDSMALAAAFSNLQVEFVDGVTHVEETALPPGAKDRNMRDPVIGAWRAHMNALRKIVDQNLTSALILEDDVDWDMRIKSQMRDFAKGSHMLIQPLHGTTDRFLDPTHNGHHGRGVSNFDIREHYKVRLPTTSPYGDVDKWDVFWLGHCGAHWPDRKGHVPLGRAVIPNDETVAETQHLRLSMGGIDVLRNEYANHTRVVHRTRGNICSLSYGVTQMGARRLVYEMGIKEMTGSFDNMLRVICDGKNERMTAKCLTVSPELFQHHRPVGPRNSHSDISGFGGYNKRAFTRNIRRSVRINFPKLIQGETDYINWFNDGEPEDKSLGFG